MGWNSSIWLYGLLGRRAIAIGRIIDAASEHQPGASGVVDGTRVGVVGHLAASMSQWCRKSTAGFAFSRPRVGH